MLTLDDVRVKAKRVLLRLDVNSPIEKGKVAGTERIEAAAHAVRLLLDGGAAVVVLAHQGRKGDDDFTGLAEHARLLGRFAGREVAFVDDVAGPKALAAVAALRPGEALVLENVRFLDDETAKGTIEDHAKRPFVVELAKRCDLYVNDAFSAAHRSQASLVGFAPLLPSVAGPTMRRELEALERVTKEPGRPAVAFLGGAKPEDSIALMRHGFDAGTLDSALVGGLVGELFLVARANDLGAPTRSILEKKGVLAHLAAAQELLDEHDERVVTPVDVGVRTPTGREDVWVEELPAKGPILDIGPETILESGRVLREAGCIIVNGPAGAYEEKGFERGTRAVLDAVRASAGFSLIGGGHTVTALERFGISHDEFGYVSLAGGALVQYLCGKTLPAIEALRVSKTRFAGKVATK